MDDSTIRAAQRHLRAPIRCWRTSCERGTVLDPAEKNRFQAAVRSIIAQQISGKAARSIWNRLRNQSGRGD